MICFSSAFWIQVGKVREKVTYWRGEVACCRSTSPATRHLFSTLFSSRMARRVISYSDLDDPNQATLINDTDSHDNKRQRRLNHNGSAQSSQSGNSSSFSNNLNGNRGGRGGNGNWNQNPNRGNNGKKGKKGNRGAKGAGNNGNHNNSLAAAGSQPAASYLNGDYDTSLMSGNRSRDEGAMENGNGKGKGKQVSSNQHQTFQINSNETPSASTSANQAQLSFYHDNSKDQLEMDGTNQGDEPEGGGNEEYYEEGTEDQDDSNYYQETEDYYEGEGYEEDSNSYDLSLSEAGDAFLASINFVPPPSTYVSTSNSKAKGGSKPLTHSQVWDDSSLISAWDAAVEEYQEFHNRRSKAKKVESALWNDSPAKDSSGNAQAIENLKSWKIGLVKEKKLKEARDYGIEKGKEVSSLKVQDQSNQNLSSKIGDASTYEITPSLQKSVDGNKAWKEACALISKNSVSNPIRIGSYLVPTPASTSQQSTNLQTSSNLNASHNVSNPPVPPIPLVGDQNMQNMIMAWYYAGYYTGVQQGLIQAQEPDVAGEEGGEGGSS